MTTGTKHLRLTEISTATEGGEEWRYVVACRCAIGVDHNDPGLKYSQFDPSEDEDGEALSVYDAADIWRFKGEDPGYMFGYSEDELRQAADED